MKRIILNLLLVSNGILFSFLPSAYAENKDIWVPVAMHMATTVSDGTLSVSDILKAAKDEGVQAVILTDRDFMKWEYGFWPLQKIVRETIEAGSVFKYGLNKYLQYIELESKKNPGLIVISGLESAPFYRWEGSPFSGNFAICDWHKHILVVLPDERDYQALPVFLNSRARGLLKGKCEVFLFWPFVTLVLGFLILRRRECSYMDIKGRELGRLSKRCRAVGILTIALSVLFIVNNCPFRRPLFDQYCSFVGVQPYQALIDYVDAKNGITFWAHPEARTMTQRGRIKIQTNDAINDLSDTTGYTGFSIFHEGYGHVGKIGGVWDDLLKEYCAGKRKAPVWATAGIAFDQGSIEDLKKALRELRLDILTGSASKRDLLTAMKNGRMVMTRGFDAAEFHLSDFFIIDDPSGKTATLGESLVFDGKVLLCIKGGSEQTSGEARITIIRDGVIFKDVVVSSPFDLVIEDEHPLQKKTYYRLEIRQGDSLMVTNPIFARPGEVKAKRTCDYGD